ncbi:MAG: hypothetical protein R6U95_08525 [Bacteroidales bacterium]
MNIIAEYSLWFILLFVLCAIGGAYVLYRKDSSFKEASRFVRSVLFTARAIVIFSVLVLLLGIYADIFNVSVEKPLLVVLQDNSQSVTVNKDASFYEEEYALKMDSVVQELSEEYEVYPYSFGENVNHLQDYSFTEKETDIAGALEHVSQQFFTRNVGAVVLASDGIYTRGNNPAYAVQNLSFDAPVYSVLLGDSVQAKDAVVHSVQANNIVFRSTPFPVQVNVRAFSVKGERVRLRIFSETEEVFSKKLRVDSQEWFHEEMCYISSDKLGKQIFRVEIEHLDGEISYENNAKDFIVDVLESRQKIAIVYNHVHPDVGVLSNALQTNKNYKVQTFHTRDFEVGSVSDYNCIVFHGIPDASQSAHSIVKSAQKQQIPCLYMYSSSMDMPALSEYNAGVELSARQQNEDEVLAIENNQFELFQIPADFTAFLKNAPSLHAPYGTYSVHPEADVCLWQTVGGIQVSRPLLLFYEVDNVKRATFLAEGLWRWRLYMNREYNSADVFDSFINRLVRYVSLQETKSLFRVSSDEVFQENQDVVLYAELYDQSFEPVIEQDISLTIRDSVKKEYTYTFTPQNERYIVNAGNFPPGTYTYSAHCIYNNKKYTEDGVLLVVHNKNEFVETRANSALMRDIAERTDGTMFTPATMHSLVDSITANSHITPVSHSVRKQSNILDYWQIFVFLVCALGIEWFLRKYYGGI